MTSRSRVLFYLFLALICYTLGAIFSAAYSAILFVTVGAIAEILFWYNLFTRKQTNKEA